ncbi:MAG: adenine deaminase, partial [Dehalobacterium sp.]
MQLNKVISAAMEQRIPELVLKNAKLVNVFSGEIYITDIALDNGYIVGMGTYSGEKEVNLSDCYVSPGLIDGHIHLESSMVTPGEFAKVVLPRGTTSVITDPHEIANVCGIEGINYIINCTEDIPLNVFIMAPSCVPATKLDENGSVLDAGMVSELLERQQVLGLAEMMNFPGVLNCNDDVLAKLTAARSKGKIIDGHAPGLSGKGLCSYVAAGIRSDHECTSYDEALEKLRLGQWVMVREGTAGKNMLDLLPLLTSDKSRRCMLVTDDKHPGDLIEEGHLDFMIRSLISRGVDPINAIQMATINTAEYFGLKELGAVAPGYRADLVVLSDLTDFTVKDVYKDGKLVVQNGELIPFTGKKTYLDIVKKSFHMPELKISDLVISGTGSQMRAIGLVPGQIVTKELFFDLLSNNNGTFNSDIERDLLKLVVVERHKNTAHIGKAFVYGYG